jgi:outer membrane protein assembly factor BamB/predicted MPP superfamily phosphohydrolase
MNAFLLAPLLGVLLQAATLRFAWLTDTHVGSETGARDLTAAVGELNARHDLDFVVLSGDITEMGLTLELKSARTILDSLRHPLYIIPGNHDTKWSESGLTAYPRLFGPERFLFFRGGYAFLGLHQGPRLRMADGHFAPEDLRWVDSALTRVREAGLPLIVVSHYPLDSGICNWYALLDRLKEMDTRMVLTGHGHRNRIDSYEGIPGLMGRSLLREGQSAGGYNVVGIANDSIAVDEMRIGDRAGHRWFAGRLARPATASAAVPAGKTPESPAAGRTPATVADHAPVPAAVPAGKTPESPAAGRTPATVADHAPVPAAVPAGRAPDAPAAGTMPAGDDVTVPPSAFSIKTGGYPRPDFSINSRYPRVEPVWKQNTGFTIAAPGAVSDSTVIVADASGTVYGFHLADGRGVWKFKAGGAVFAAPYASGGMVIFTTADSAVIALNAKTGRRLWSIRTEAPNVAAPVISDNTVFVGGSDGKFRALDAATGAVKWTFDSLGGFVESRPAVSSQAVLFGAWDEHLYALSRQSGKVLWTWKGERAGRLYSPAACWPVVAHGKAFIVAPDRMMTAFDVQTGKVLWRTGAHQVRESIGISSNGDHVYVRLMRDSLVAFDSRSPEPRVAWATDLGFGYDINAAMPVERDGVVYYGTKNGTIFAVRDNDGTLLWQHRISAVPVNTITSLDHGHLLATTFDGDVVLLSWSAE